MLHNDFITTYLTEVRIENTFFLIVGLITIALAFIFLGIIKYSFFKGMAIPLLVLGIIELSAGAISYNQSQKYSNNIQLLKKYNTEEVQAEELKRMQIILKNYTIYSWIELLLICIGLLLFIRFNKSPQTFWKGFGLGLLIQAIILFALHLLTEQTGKMYIEQLTNYQPRI
jgi:glucan phosphoethanolaminetransferase (alkaline phosphatase superfamily)